MSLPLSGAPPAQYRASGCAAVSPIYRSLIHALL